MADRPRFFDDIAGVAGGAFSALTGMKDELEAQVRARVDEAIRRLELVKREELEAVAEMAANARAGQEAAEARLAALESRVAELVLAGGAPSPAAAAAAASAVAPDALPKQADHPGDKPAGASSVAPAALPPDGAGAARE